MRELWLKIAHTSGATGLSVLASIATLAITARVLGPSGRGVYASALAWVTLFAALGNLSMGQVIIHRVAGRPKEDWLPDITGSALVVTLGATAAGWGVIAVLYLAGAGELFGAVPPEIVALVFVALPFLLWSDTGRYILTAMGALAVSNWAQIAGALVAVVGIALFVWVADAGVGGAVAAYLLSAATVTVLTLRYITRIAGSIRVRGSHVRQMLGGSAQLHLNTVGTYLFTQASVLVMNYYRPAEETGYYQLSMQLFGLSLIVSSSISIVSFELVAQKGPDGAWPEQRRLLLHATLVVAVLAGVAYMLAPLLIRIVAGESFLPSATLYRMVLPALVGATFSTVMASQWIGRGLFLQAALLTLIVGLVSLTSDLLLIPPYGMRGAVASTLITYGISVFGNGIMVLWVQARWSRRELAVS